MNRGGESAEKASRILLSVILSLTYIGNRLITTVGVVFSMNSPKEPEPGHRRHTAKTRPAGRILRIASVASAGLVRVQEEFIGG
jgi:hypothetical protein